MVVTFIGHRKLQFDDGFRLRLKELILALIDDRGADTFLFGSRSDFNDLCLGVVTELRKERPQIKRVYVRAEYPYIDKEYEEYLLGSYDATYISDNVAEAGKAAYVERNYHMIDRADLCIFYSDESSLPPIRYASGKQISSFQPKSGTKIAYDHAVAQKKEILNLFSPTFTKTQDQTGPT